MIRSSRQEVKIVATFEICFDPDAQVSIFMHQNLSSWRIASAFEAPSGSAKLPDATWGQNAMQSCCISFMKSRPGRWEWHILPGPDISLFGNHFTRIASLGPTQSELWGSKYN
jgi:hypothetical protein